MNSKKDFRFIGICSACEKGYYLKDNKCLKINEKINLNFKNLLINNIDMIVKNYVIMIIMLLLLMKMQIKI